MEQVEQFVVVFADTAWKYLLYLLIGGGLFLLLYSRFIPFRFFKHSIDITDHLNQLIHLKQGQATDDTGNTEKGSQRFPVFTQSFGNHVHRAALCMPGTVLRPVHDG